MDLMKNISLTTAEREFKNDAPFAAPARRTVSADATKTAPPALDLDEIHHQALMRLGHDRRRYPSEK
jgi:hypothetical protein